MAPYPRSGALRRVLGATALAAAAFTAFSRPDHVTSIAANVQSRTSRIVLNPATVGLKGGYPTHCRDFRRGYLSQQSRGLRRISGRSTARAEEITVGDVTALLSESEQTGGWSGSALRPGGALDGSLGLYFQRNVKKGEEILSIDVTGPLCLTVDKVDSSALGPLVEKLQSWEKLALYLLFEKHRGSAEYRRFEAGLNTEPGTPMLWDEAEAKKLLEGTQAWELSEQYKQYVDGEWANRVQPLIQNAKPDIFAHLKDVSLEDFRWAFSVVRANSFAPFDSNQDLTIIALPGLFRHTRAKSASLQVKKGGFLGLGGGGSGAKISIVAEKDYAEGSLASFNVAPTQTESQVFVNYGLADSAQPSEAVELKLWISEEDRFFGDKADVVEQEGLPLTQAFAVNADSDPSYELQRFLRLTLLKDKDAFILEPIFRDDLWNEHLTLPFSEQNEEDMCNAMIDWATNRKMRIPGTLEDDLALKESGRVFPGSREDLALAVRMGERRALQQTINYFKRRLASFSSITFYQERRLMKLNLLTEDGKSTFDPFKDNIA